MITTRSAPIIGKTWIFSLDRFSCAEKNIFFFSYPQVSYQKLTSPLVNYEECENVIGSTDFFFKV